MPQAIIGLQDVKLAALIGKPQEGIGCISLSGFAANAGQEVQQAVLVLERATEDATNGDQGLQGLVLDLQGNPGGLLTSAVDDASLLVPKGSDIVLAKGRGFPGAICQSRVDPSFEPKSEACGFDQQGNCKCSRDRLWCGARFGCRSHRWKPPDIWERSCPKCGGIAFQHSIEIYCCQASHSKWTMPPKPKLQRRRRSERRQEDVKCSSSKVAEQDRQTFCTRVGRFVKDGGGVEAGFKVQAPKASMFEITLLRSNVLGEFASQWSRKNQLTNNCQVDDIEHDPQGTPRFHHERRNLGMSNLKSSALVR
jgi:hypothetical protein